VAALVIGIFWMCAQSGLLELLGGKAANSYYNLLVEGFQAGHVSLNKPVPPGLAQLADPYDPDTNHAYRYSPYVLHDLSYFRGKLYLYFGVTPALVLFWPVAALTGHYLLHREAVVIFCSVGVLASLGLVHGIWRRYFPEVPTRIAGAAALALGLATSVPIVLQPGEVYEVAISCAYACTMLALVGIWLALHRPAERVRWLAAASLAFGLAVGARPTGLPSSAILLIPLLAAAEEARAVPPGKKSPLLHLLLAAAGPLTLCGLGLMAYNAQRFGSPFEFGQRYQVSSLRQDTVHFRLSYLWFNFRLYFLEPRPLHAGFPFMVEDPPRALPPGYGLVEQPFGILPNIPFVLCALAAPLACRHGARRRLGWFLAGPAVLFAIPAFLFCLYFAVCPRYEMEFVPALVLLAVVGVFGLEGALAGRPGTLGLVRAGWGLLLAYSIALNLLAGFERHAEERWLYGDALLAQGHVPESIAEFRGALRLKPTYAKAHVGLGLALAKAGRPAEAVPEFQASLQGDLDQAEARANLGYALVQLGRVPEAVVQFEQVARLQPDSPKAHFNLAYGLQGTGRLAEALPHYEAAVRLQPDSGAMRYGLAVALRQAGRESEAAVQFQKAVDLDPNLLHRLQ
jgi:Flp pilus assembly protein TadD